MEKKNITGDTIALFNKSTIITGPYAIDNNAINVGKFASATQS